MSTEVQKKFADIIDEAFEVDRDNPFIGQMYEETAEKSLKGGSGSGNFNHSGRPGEVGGSMADSANVNSYTTQGKNATHRMHSGFNYPPGKPKPTGEGPAGGSAGSSHVAEMNDWRIIATPRGNNKPLILENDDSKHYLHIFPDGSWEHGTITGPDKFSLRDYLEKDLSRATSFVRRMQGRKSMSLKGGQGSGNFGHSGRPGQRGGSGPGNSQEIANRWVSGQEVSDNEIHAVMESVSEHNKIARAWLNNEEVDDSAIDSVMNEVASSNSSSGKLKLNVHTSSQKSFKSELKSNIIIRVKELALKGGQGSGNFSHSGRPGLRGGSSKENQKFQDNLQATLAGVPPKGMFAYNDFVNTYTDYKMNDNDEHGADAYRKYLGQAKQAFKKVEGLQRVRGKQYPDLVKEYISEAQHQDGVEVWDQYANVKEVVADFDLYQKNSKSIKGGQGSGNFHHSGRPGYIGGSGRDNYNQSSEDERLNAEGQAMIDARKEHSHVPADPYVSKYKKLGTDLQQIMDKYKTKTSGQLELEKLADKPGDATDRSHDVLYQGLLYTKTGKRGYYNAARNMGNGEPSAEFQTDRGLRIWVTRSGDIIED